MTQLCHTNGFMESVRPWKLCTNLEIDSDYLRKLADLLNFSLGIWADVDIKAPCLLKFSVYA